VPAPSFATHYHQLIELAAKQKGVKNYNVAVREGEGRIIFLHRIVEGGTSRSFGIQVAKLAGLPEEVLLRAAEVLANLEREEWDPVGKPKPSRARSRKEKGPAQIPLFMPEEERIAEEIRHLDVSRITPLDALTLIHTWRKWLEATHAGKK